MLKASHAKSEANSTALAGSSAAEASAGGLSGLPARSKRRSSVWRPSPAYCRRAWLRLARRMAVRALPVIEMSGTDEAALSGYWNKLKEGGTIQQPLEKAPWGDSFGMCVDRFGVTWMVNIGSSPG